MEGLNEPIYDLRRENTVPWLKTNKSGKIFHNICTEFTHAEKSPSMLKRKKQLIRTILRITDKKKGLTSVLGHSSLNYQREIQCICHTDNPKVPPFLSRPYKNGYCQYDILLALHQGILLPYNSDLITWRLLSL